MPRSEIAGSIHVQFWIFMGFVNSCPFKEPLPIYLSIESLGRGPSSPHRCGCLSKAYGHVWSSGNTHLPLVFPFGCEQEDYFLSQSKIPKIKTPRPQTTGREGPVSHSSVCKPEKRHVEPTASLQPAHRALSERQEAWWDSETLWVAAGYYKTRV